MAGTIHEFFGYRATDRSAEALSAAKDQHCPFLDARCQKTLSDGTISGVCSVKPMTSNPVICCPIRMYANHYQILRDVADRAFGEGYALKPGSVATDWALDHGEAVVAVFGKGWGGELRLPKRDGVGNYFVDWVLGLVNKHGILEEFVATEVQTIDTTGNYRSSRDSLLTPERLVQKSSVGLNWENVNKRIIPQLVYKGQVLQREELCRKGMFFICPTPVYERIMKRLGGAEKLVRYALQPASITFLAYDCDYQSVVPDGETSPLVLTTSHSTTVYKVQEAFNNVTLPSENVYRSAIEDALAANPAQAEGHKLFTLDYRWGNKE